MHSETVFIFTLVLVTSTFARAQSSCASEAISMHAQRVQTVAYSQEERYRLISSSPLRFEQIRRYLDTRSGAFVESMTERTPLSESNVRIIVENFQGSLQHCRQTAACNVQTVAAIENTINTITCWVTSQKTTAGERKASPDAGASLDSVTPQVPGCPRYLRKDLVEFRRVGGSPESTSWVVRNVSQRILKVTFRENGQNADSETLNPGSEDVLSLQNGKVPAYVVRDFGELMEFNRMHSSNKELMQKSLQCSLSIRPQ